MKLLLLLFFFSSCSSHFLKRIRHISSNQINGSCVLKNYPQVELDKINDEIKEELGESYTLIKTDLSNNTFLTYGNERISHNLIYKKNLSNVFSINVGGIFFLNFDKGLQDKLGDELWEKICGNTILISNLKNSSLLNKEQSPFIISTLVQMQKHNFKYKPSFIFGDRDNILSLAALRLGAIKVYIFQLGKKKEEQEDNFKINDFLEMNISHINPENKKDMFNLNINRNKNIIVISHNGRGYEIDGKTNFLTNEYPILLADYFHNITDYIFGGYRSLPKFFLTHLIHDRKLIIEKKFKYNPSIARFKPHKGFFSSGLLTPGEDFLSFSWSAFYKKKEIDQSIDILDTESLKKKRAEDKRNSSDFAEHISIDQMKQLVDIESDVVDEAWFNTFYYQEFLKFIKKNNDKTSQAIETKRNTKSATIEWFKRIFYEPFLKFIRKKKKTLDSQLIEILELRKSVKPYYGKGVVLSRRENLHGVVAIDPNGKYIASGSWGNTVRIWDTLSTNKPLGSMISHDSGVKSLSWDPSGKLIASGSWDKTIKIWDVNSRKLLKTLIGHHKVVYSVSWDPSGKFIASGSADKTVRIWNVQTGNTIKTLEVEGGTASSVSWDPSGKYIVSGSFDNNIKIWDVKSGRLIKTLLGHHSQVHSVSWNPTGKYIASGSSDSTIKIWNAQTGLQIKSLEGNGNTVWSVSWSPDGKYLASGSVDSTVRIWNISSGKIIKYLKVRGTENSVSSVSWDPTGKLIASGTKDGTLKIWKITYK